jgi:hypothetical protein
LTESLHFDGRKGPVTLEVVSLGGGKSFDQLDLKVQIRPESPNGVILEWVSTAVAHRPGVTFPDEPLPPYHRLFLEDGIVKYAFSMAPHGSEGKNSFCFVSVPRICKFLEVVQSGKLVELDKWTTIHITNNEGRGTFSIAIILGILILHISATLQLNSDLPTEIFYSYQPTPIEQPFTGATIKLGGSRINQMHSIGFVGTIGNLMVNNKQVAIPEQKVTSLSKFVYVIGNRERPAIES